ncbi:hypothetical protein [Zhihengliuella halotolerans]|uniref:hypothetical protein n=1 Tax=Zhihengliuella halotolerans TaxID=370736 RepID=UPI0011AF9140|nr:hypothetical protein [Zhihengliuella halotolerans]
MTHQVIISVLYAVAFSLPATKLIITYVKARKHLAAHRRSEQHRARIDSEYGPRIQVLEDGFNEYLLGPKRPKDGRRVMEVPEAKALHDRLEALKREKRKEYDQHGVYYLTFADFNKQFGDDESKHPSTLLGLAGADLFMVGLGAVLATAASIWSVWI